MLGLSRPAAGLKNKWRRLARQNLVPYVESFPYYASVGMLHEKQSQRIRYAMSVTASRRYLTKAASTNTTGTLLLSRLSVAISR